MKTIIKLTVVAISLTCLSAAWAVVPELIPVQGYLTDNSSGNPVDGLTDMRFDIYSAQSGGTLLWESVYNSATRQVDVDQGYFAVYLGELGAYPLNFLPLIQENELWLQLTVGAEVMDRVRMASIAFSEQAQFCNEVGNLGAAEIQPLLDPPCDVGNYLRGWNPVAGTPICAPDQIEPTGTHYYNVSGCDVIFEHSNDQAIQLSNYCEVLKTANSAHTNVFIPVHLSDGVTVTAVRVWVRDNNGNTNANVYVRLYRRSVVAGSTSSSPSSATLTACDTATGGESADIRMIEDTSVANATINNLLYDYYFWITLGNTTTEYADMSFYKAQIDYTFN